MLVGLDLDNEGLFTIIICRVRFTHVIFDHLLNSINSGIH